MTEPTQGAKEFEFRRTECGCGYCQIFCRHLPGALDPADLSRICPPQQEVFAWAEEHLRAQVDKPYPTLVPSRRLDGPCHWYFDGKCAVHDRAPYGCAFFDSHMTEGEVSRRVGVTVQAIRQDMADHGLYYRIWLHLRKKGLVARVGNRSALLREMHKIRRRGERQQGKITAD